MERKSILKQDNLYFFTPCVVVFSYRRYSNIRNFTGIMVADFDHIDNAIEFKEFIFNEYKQIIAAWISPSGHGVKAFVKIPIVKTVDEFKEYFYGFANEMEIYDGFDGTGQNSVLPLFQSWDPELLTRDDYSIWTKKGIKEDEFTNSTPIEIPTFEITNKDKEKVINIIKKAFQNIDTVGHWPLRGIALTTGGYIAAGYIDQFEAESLFDSLIENHHYLRQKASTYKKTARWGFERGKNKPLILKHG
jgi:hypothetical protein